MGRGNDEVQSLIIGPHIKMHFDLVSPKSEADLLQSFVLWNVPMLGTRGSGDIVHPIKFDNDVAFCGVDLVGVVGPHKWQVHAQVSGVSRITGATAKRGWLEAG